jgi:O-acetylserine/cysteine efflux transporter
MPIRHVLLALVVVAIWGFNFVVIKLSVEAMPPIFAAALRFLAVALPAVFFVRPPKAPAWLVIAYGLAFGFALYAFLNLSMAWGMPAGLSSLVLQVQAFFTMIIAFLILGERPNRFQIMGAGVAFFGIAVIATERLSGTALLPLSFTVLGAFAWGIANVLTRMAGRVNPLSLTVWGGLAAPLPLLALSFLTEGGEAIFGAIASFSWGDAGLIAFLAYPSSMLGGVIWAWLLMRHPASVVAPFTLLVPVTGLVSAYLLLGEMITAVEILGALFVIAGLAVTLMKKRSSV